jgi:acetamidase/formamidase
VEFAPRRANGCDDVLAAYQPAQVRSEVIMAEHRLARDRVHTKWNRDLAPAIEIESGDVVVFETQDVSGGQIEPGASAGTLAAIDFARIHPLTGPVFVKGARPGDILEVEIIDVQAGRWGWTGIWPRPYTLLPQEFSKPHITHWDLSNGQDTQLRPNIVIPLDPFCGVMGVAPAQSGAISVLPPARYGGNMDIRHLTRRTTLFLPVQVEGALFSTGDGHAAQGDGEVCSGIEAPMIATLRIRFRKGRPIAGPQFITAGPLTTKYDRKGYYATTGIADDLLEAAREATRSMIAHLTTTYALTPEDAYILCSVAVDLKISEVVNAPMWVVSAYLPLSIFREE